MLGLQLLKEAVPGITRVAYLSDIGTEYAPEAAARALKVTLIPFSVDAPDKLHAELATITCRRVDAIYVATGSFFWAQRGTIIYTRVSTSDQNSVTTRRSPQPPE